MPKIGDLKSVVNDSKNGVSDFTVNGKCSDCGNCCSNLLPLSQAEISAIHRYIRKHNIKECVHFIPAPGAVLDMTCPFRDNQRKICTIYKVRPTICRVFRCNNTQEKILADKRNMEKVKRIIDMREEFFGK